MAQRIWKWVASCGQCSKKNRIDKKLLRPHVQHPSDYITCRKNAIQVVLVLGLRLKRKGKYFSDNENTLQINFCLGHVYIEQKTTAAVRIDITS